MKVTIVGAGIIGVTVAYYLVKKGVEVEIIERTNGDQGCSFGNAGYICPSHFMPLPSPGIVAEGIRYMLDSTSPFYIKPRLDYDLIKWGYHFVKSANQKTADKNSIALHELSQISHKQMISLAQENDNAFDLKEDGCLMMYRLEETAQHELEMEQKANKLGIKTTVLDKKQLKDVEPTVSDHLIGAVWYHQDCHINPVKYMVHMRQVLKDKGVKFHFDTDVLGFIVDNSRITHIKTCKGQIGVDKVLIATGAWLPSITKDLNESLLMQAGKGYSVTYQYPNKNLSRPAILLDDRVAMTPFQNQLRIGGTMEISGVNNEIRMSRVKGIVNAVNKNMTFENIGMPAKEKVWYGLRPCSPDGLPYLGKSNHTSNLFIAGGHAMLGISLSAGSGFAMSQLITETPAPMNLSPFRLERFKS